MLATSFYDGIKWIHVMAVVIGFGGAFLYPIWFAALQNYQSEQRAFFHRVQATIGKFVISPALLVLVLTGAFMATDRDYWDEPWVTVPLVIAIFLGALGGVYFGPREERLADLQTGPEYQALMRQMRTVTYVSLALVAIAAYFMVAKPFA